MVCENVPMIKTPTGLIRKLDVLSERVRDVSVPSAWRLAVRLTAATTPRAQA
jgi:hypothetical protein